MKKSFLILLVAILGFSTPSFSQIKIGVKGAMNITDLSLNNVGDNFSTSNRVGFAVGPIVDFKIPILGFGLDAAVLLSYKTAKVKTANAERTIKENGIDIPINFKYNFGLSSIVGFYLAAGPDFFFNLGKDQTISDTKFKKESARIGLNLGGGIKLFNHLQIGAAYNIPLKKSAKNGESNSSYKSKTWELSAAYFF